MNIPPSVIFTIVISVISILKDNLNEDKKKKF